MALSAFDLFTVGIGPSSSHTVGPMRAAVRFARGLDADGLLKLVTRLHVELFGSLGATGHGHGSPGAVMLGLAGHDPETVDPEAARAKLTLMRNEGSVPLLGRHRVPFDIDADLVMHRTKRLPLHPNGMTFAAYQGQQEVSAQTYYSVGGGFVMVDDGAGNARLVEDNTTVAHPFRTGDELLAICAVHGKSVARIMLENELSWRTEAQVRDGLLCLWQVMHDCVARGIANEGVLPGGLRVRRRAPELALKLRQERDSTDPLRGLGWITMYALAVNEENAAGGRVVTAPTNGAAGIIPAVLQYYVDWVPGADDDAVVRFLLTAAALGVIIKECASISGAEVGCQGEVGSACAMAATRSADSCRFRVSSATRSRR